MSNRTSRVTGFHTAAGVVTEVTKTPDGRVTSVTTVDGVSVDTTGQVPVSGRVEVLRWWTTAAADVELVKAIHRNSRAAQSLWARPVTRLTDRVRTGWKSALPTVGTNGDEAA